MIIPQLALQKACRSLFLADPDLAPMVKAILDVPVEGTPLPYVRFVEGTMQPWDTKGAHGCNITLGFQVFDSGTTTTRARTIQAHIRRLLHGQQIELDDGLTAIADHQMDFPVIVDPKNGTIGLVSRYSFLIS